jgi:fatty acid desaturase
MTDTQTSRPPLYYRPGEVRALRDGDRRAYRNRAIGLIIYQILILGSIRLVIDFFLAQKGMQHLAFLKGYVVLVMVVAALAVWFFGISIIFKRKY